MSDTRLLYDPSTPSFQTELWDIYRTMREFYPVYHDPDGGFYALTRFADVWAAAADHETFSSRVAEANDLLPQLIYMDPPRQTALRKLVSRVFTPRRVAAMEDDIRDCIRRLVVRPRRALLHGLGPGPPGGPPRLRRMILSVPRVRTGR
jgi:cytochrome P450 family 130